jgi:hypothetical protein
MSKLLDLRNKSFDKVKVVEHIIFKPRSFKVEMIKMLSIIAIVSVLGWGISHADNLNPFLENGIETATENFSSIGIVSEISESSISLTEARGSDKSGNTTYNLDITNLEKVETNAYTPLIITDIKIGDRIIAQGLTNGNKFFIKRIVSFGGGIDLVTTTDATSTVEVATSTASTTDETATSTTDGAGSSNTNNASTTTDTSTTTEIITETATTTATSTEVSTSTTDIATTTASTTTATTTPGIIEQVGDVVQDIIDTVTETVQNVINTVTGTSTPAVAPTVETSTSSEPVAPTVLEVPSNPTPTPAPTVTPTSSSTPNI